MTKTEAINLFDGVANLARAIGITSQAISQWPEELNPRLADRVTAALARRTDTVARQPEPKPAKAEEAA